MFLNIQTMKFCMVQEEVTTVKILREQLAGRRVRPVPLCRSTGLWGLMLLGTEERVTLKSTSQRVVSSKVLPACREIGSIESFNYFRPNVDQSSVSFYQAFKQGC